jgi:hypothetical protein
MSVNLTTCQKVCANPILTNSCSETPSQSQLEQGQWTITAASPTGLINIKVGVPAPANTSATNVTITGTTCIITANGGGLTGTATVSYANPSIGVSAVNISVTVTQEPYTASFNFSSSGPVLKTTSITCGTGSGAFVGAARPLPVVYENNTAKVTTNNRNISTQQLQKQQIQQQIFGGTRSFRQII